MIPARVCPDPFTRTMFRWDVGGAANASVRTRGGMTALIPVRAVAKRSCPKAVPHMASEPEGRTRWGNAPKPEEIVAKLRPADVLVSQGQSVSDAIVVYFVTSSSNNPVEIDRKLTGDNSGRSGPLRHSP